MCGGAWESFEACTATIAGEEVVCKAKDDISVDPNKVEAVVEWNRLNNVTKICSF